MRYCPYAERAMIALSLKEIPHEVINVRLYDEKPGWYLMKNPLGKVPTLEKDGKILYESLIVAEFLDQVHPDHKMLPGGPYEQGLQKILVERLGKLTANFYPLYRNPHDTTLISNLVEVFGLYEELLIDDYFGGKQPLWADYMSWPWLERLNSLNKHTGGKLNLDKHPKLVAYIGRMKSLPEIQRVLKSDEAHYHFLQSAMAGKTDFDFESK
jgi:glutathione S-transferase